MQVEDHGQNTNVEATYAIRLKKLLIGCGVVICGLTLIIIILLFYSSSAPLTVNLNDSPVICTTKACVKTANMMLENMNISVDPCEDFYQFSCGGYIHKTRLDEQQSATNTFNQLDKNLNFLLSDLLSEEISNKDIESIINAKKLFRSCLNERNTEENGEKKVLSFINSELDGWPMLNPSRFVNNKEHTLKKLTKLFQYGVNPIFNMYVTSSPSDPNIALIKISQASWFLIKDYYDDREIMRNYKLFIMKFLTTMNSTSQNLDEEVNRIIEIERLLAKNLLTTEQRRRSTFRTMSLKSLIENQPDFSWKEFIANGVFKGIGQIDLYDNEVILVNDWNYVSNAVDIYTQFLRENKRDLDNLLVWVFAKSVMEYLPSKYNKLVSEFKKFLQISKASQSRSLFCTNFVGSRMEFALGRLYVSNYFDSNAKKHALEMVNNLKKEFNIMLNEYDWMDSISKQAALEKAQMMNVLIGYPDYTYDDSYLNKLYLQYQFSEVEYFENTLLADKIMVLNNLKELRKRVDRTSWLMGPAEVNAYYSASFNQICFPAGILQMPFYDAENPNYLNYGGIGSVIGHEITHGFDDKGRSYDKNGIFRPDGEGGLWTNETIENYKKKSKCIVDQYSRFVVKEINKTMNGFQTQGENIADNGGVKESFRAYKRWSERNGPEPLLPGLKFTQDQLFFINFAQVWCGKYKPSYLNRAILVNVHSLGEFRVKGTTSNSNEFAKAFNCKPNQKNNPREKCSIW